MNAFSAAEDDVLKNTVHGAQRLVIADQFVPAFLAEAEKAHPEYFGRPAAPKKLIRCR